MWDTTSNVYNVQVCIISGERETKLSLDIKKDYWPEKKIKNCIKTVLTHILLIFI